MIRLANLIKLFSDWKEWSGCPDSNRGPPGPKLKLKVSSYPLVTPVIDHYAGLRWKVVDVLVESQRLSGLQEGLQDGR